MDDERLLHRGCSFPEAHVTSVNCTLILKPTSRPKGIEDFEVKVPVQSLDNRGRGFAFPALAETEVYERDGTGVVRFALTHAGRAKMPDVYRPMLREAKRRIPLLVPLFTE